MFEIQPVLGPRQSTFRSEFVIRRRSRQRDQWTEYRHHGGPLGNLFQSSIGDAGRVVVETKNKRSDCIDITLGQSIKDRGVFGRLVEALVYIGQIRGIERLHANEYPHAA